MACAADPPTFNNQIVRIFQRQCQSCHHPGDIGPFSLMDYTSARPYSQRIKTRVTERSMPPWPPAAGVGDFQDARVLREQEIDLTRQWVDAGSPEGDPKDLPPPLTFPDGWVLGQPDLVLGLREDFSPAAAGKDVYRCFSLPTGLAEDRHVRAVQIRAGNRSIVHHVLLFSDPQGASGTLDDKEEGPGYSCFGGPGFAPDDSFFGGWAPGVRPMLLAPGLGMRLRANSRIAMQVHYHPQQDGARDRTEVGVYFASTPVDKIVRVYPLANPFFRIPAGNPRYEVKSLPFPTGLGDVHIVNIAPHMHLLGREIKVQATYPDNRVAPLIRIPDWDFQWQGIYEYRQPVPAPAGTRLEFTASYDNSADNPRNPNSPPKDVTWGEQTTDEMALVFFGYTRDSEHLAPPQFSAGGIVNAASFVAGASAPGAIVSLFGSGLASAWEAASTLPLPSSLAGGTKVTVNGVDAPLFYASPSQINFQAPFELSGSAATVTVTRAGDRATQSVSLPLGEVQPGIFTLTSDGKGPAAVLHAVNGVVVSATSPAARGEWVSLYATGLGRVSPSAQSGSAPAGLSSTLGAAVVIVGTSGAEVGFAGLAPGYAGLYQVNFRIPPGAATGPEVPLRLTISGVAGNTTTLAVK